MTTTTTILSSTLDLRRDRTTGRVLTAADQDDDTARSACNLAFLDDPPPPRWSDIQKPAWEGAPGGHAVASTTAGVRRGRRRPGCRSRAGRRTRWRGRPGLPP